jgi:tetratricopeptide (TPR) repeat protein
LVYANPGKYDEAIRLLKEATEITGKALGKEHPEYARNLNNLAVTYYKTGRYSEALPLFEEASQIWEETLSPEHPNIAIVKESIKNCRMTMGINS